MLWLALSLFLVARGDRRAALRGMLSLALGSGIANLLGKRVFGGERPLPDAVPLARRIARQPSSPSFPSGHAASAAAFTTGVALESPGNGAAVAPIAVAVAFSRVHVGAHWVSDVIAGVAVGVGAALLGAMFGPVEPRRLRTAEAPSVDLPRLERGAGLLVFVNPNAGRNLHRANPSALLRRELPECRIHLLAVDDDVDTILSRFVGIVAVGAYGGDGTVSAIAATARRRGLPLMVLPGGTFNHFARTVGASTLSAAISAARNGTGRVVDVGELTYEHRAPITVLNTASIGIYPRFVTERGKLERRLGKPLAAIIASIGVLSSADPIGLKIGGRDARVWSIFLGVGRFSAGLAPLSRERLDAGILDVRILHAQGVAHKPRGVAALAFGSGRSTTLDRFPLRVRRTTESFVAQEVTIATGISHDRDVAHDGETLPGDSSGKEPSVAPTISIRIIPFGLRVYA